MLCQFTFQNFKSYKNETTLDYQAAVLPEFKNTLITETSASDLLPVNVVYGPNGGGKSNLLQALAEFYPPMDAEKLRWLLIEWMRK